jgi:hypothetical protein
MKKITLLLAIAVGLVFATSAQKNATQITTKDVVLTKTFSVNQPKVITHDTIWPTSIAGGCDSIRLYLVSDADGGGYITGNNGYGDIEKGTLVKYTSAGLLTSVNAALLRGGTVGTSTIKVNVYSKDANALPGTLLGSSADINIGMLTPDQLMLVPFTFSPGIVVSGDFFISVVLPTTTGDTIAVAATSKYCTPLNDTLSIERWDNGTFKYIKTAYGGSLNLDLFMSANIETGAGIISNAIENVNVFAANNEIVIENNQNANIKQIAVYNVLGQEVANYNVNSKETVRLNLNLASANYVVKVVTDKNVGSYKLFVK